MNDHAGGPLVAIHEYPTLFRQSPTLMLVLDPDLNIVEATNAYLDATLTTRAQAIGRLIFDVFPDNPEDPQATGVANLRASLERVLRHRSPDTMAVQRYDVRRPNDHGQPEFETRYWSPRNVPVFDPSGQIIYILHRAEDVTDFVKTPPEAPQSPVAAPGAPSVDLLHAELVRRTQELQASNQALRDADNAKTEFLSRASHELRTPMNSVLGFAHLLTIQNLDQPYHDWVVMILKAGRHLLALLDDILDISRIESGHLTVSTQNVPVVSILGDSADLVRTLAQDHDVTMRLPPGSDQTRVTADPNRLRQVLTNLLSNAVKYNRPGGTVTVDLSSTPGGSVRLTVTDTGRGITPDGLRKLFNPFERLDAQKQGIEGTGLGLALSRHLVEVMNGTIMATSTPGTGSSFTVSLPAATDTAGVQDPAAADPRPPVKREYRETRQVLYVEDVTDNVILVEQALRQRPSITLTPAGLGTTALRQAYAELPDLILLDLHLPDIAGEEVMRRLRTESGTRQIPIVILTADATRNTSQRLLDAGADALLTKPVDIPLLLTTLDQFLDN
ncbi:hypothetical protein GCM10010172_34380 [Paractinoplanes ferrugineus]|uniref:histidine kinase n=1 Tax=Paractinoplanes ferrugineus TaxID=113564 RepID=A0A919JA55_9ACTN|nr:PAS domain-containing sensor histidine kinase [Actinoplanes ferrugineus]GIE15489.1 hypothetical protein Afe05nite_73290 [Actinoplanes ferrugineus]